jgi:hypothetical protein
MARKITTERMNKGKSCWLLLDAALMMSYGHIEIWRNRPLQGCIWHNGNATVRKLKSTAVRSWIASIPER